MEKREKLGSRFESFESLSGSQWPVESLKSRRKQRKLGFPQSGKWFQRAVLKNCSSRQRRNKKKHTQKNYDYFVIIGCCPERLARKLRQLSKNRTRRQKTTQGFSASPTTSSGALLVQWGTHFWVFNSSNYWRAAALRAPCGERKNFSCWTTICLWRTWQTKGLKSIQITCWDFGLLRELFYIKDF